MNIAQIGLDSMYWPIVWAEALRSPTATAPVASRESHRLVACCDLGVSPQDVKTEIGMTAAEFAAKHGLALYSTVEDLLAKETIDAALVATRHTRLPRVAAQLIERGVPCYIAKPMAASPADALLLADLAERRGVPATSGVTARCFDHYQAVHRIVQERRIGRVVSISIMHQHGSYAAWPERTWYRDPAEGGVPYWLGWYPLDAIRWFAGSPIATVTAYGVNVTNAVKGEHEVIAAGGTTQNGVCWTCRIYFAAGLKWRFPMHEVEVCGDKGIVRALSDSRIQVFDDLGASEQPVTPLPGAPVPRELLAWLGSLTGKAAWRPTLKELAHTVTACEALRRSLTTGQTAHV